MDPSRFAFGFIVILLRVSSGSDVIHALAISDSESGKIVIVDGKGTAEAIHTIENLHTKSVRCIEVSFFKF